MDTLAISDGTTTIDLAGSNFHLLWGRWSPRIARRRTSELAGQPYTDVAEEMALRITGSSTANILARLGDLVKLLDQAELWQAGENVEPVLLEYLAEGGGVSLQAPILGGEVTLPRAFDALSGDVGLGSLDDPIILKFSRRGLWADSDFYSITGTAVENPGVMVANLAENADYPSPIRVEPGGWTGDDHDNVPAGFVVVAAAETDIFVVEAETLTASGWTAVADAANKARSGSVLRFTAGDGEINYSGTYTVDSGDFNNETPLVGVFACVRNNSNDDFLVRAETTSYVMGSGQITDAHPVLGSDNDPQWLFLGILNQAQGHYYLRLSGQCAAGDGSQTLDVDAMVLVAMRPGTYVYKLNSIDSLAAPFVTVSSATIRLLIDPQHLERPVPFVGYTESAGNKRADVGYQGDGGTYLAGSQVAAIWLGTRDNYWRCVTNGGDVTELSLRVMRRKGFLAPV